MNADFESKFLNADCMEVMREYPDNFFDLAIVDPPYGAANPDSTRGGADIGTASADGSTSTKPHRKNRRKMGEEVREKNHSVGHCPGKRIL